MEAGDNNKNKSAPVVDRGIKLIVMLPVLLVYTVLWAMFVLNSGGAGPIVTWFSIAVPFLAFFIYFSTEIMDMFGDFTGSAFYSKKKFKTDAPQYSIPEGLAKGGEYEKAIEAYEVLAKQFRDEHLAFLKIIEISSLKLEDQQRCEKYYKMAIQQFIENDTALKELKHKYDHCKKMLNRRIVEREEDKEIEI